MNRPLTEFLCWLIADPGRLESYQTADGFSASIEAWESESGMTLSEGLRAILEANNLRAAMDAVKSETGSDQVMFFVIRFVR